MQEELKQEALPDIPLFPVLAQQGAENVVERNTSNEEPDKETKQAKAGRGPRAASTRSDVGAGDGELQPKKSKVLEHQAAPMCKSLVSGLLRIQFR